MQQITGEYPCQSVISIKLPCNFIEITLRQECSSVNLLHIFRTPFPRTTSGCLLLIIVVFICVVRMFWAIIYSYSVDSLETSGNKFNILVNLTELGNISSMLISYLKLKISLKYYLCDFLTFQSRRHLKPAAFLVSNQYDFLVKNIFSHYFYSFRCFIKMLVGMHCFFYL